MNERTEALAKQAAEYAIEFATQDQELYIPKLMEKFAELIVQECMNVLHDNELWNRHISHALKEHFGIE